MRGRVSALSLLGACAAASLSLTAPQASLLFGLLAEDVLFLDPEVGACCHSACADCEWRTADGGYRFDVLRAARPKWIGCYLRRDFDDERGVHTPLWASALFDDPVGDAEVDRARFDAALRTLSYRATLGPKGAVPGDVAAAGADDESVEALWEWLADGSAGALTAARVRSRLQDMALDADREGAVGEGPDAVDWKGFAKALGAKPFDRF